MFRFIYRGSIYFGSQDVHAFRILNKSAVVSASVVWVVFHVVKRAIPTFDFWEETKSSWMVNTMASSAGEGGFRNHSGSL